MSSAAALRTKRDRPSAGHRGLIEFLIAAVSGVALSALLGLVLDWHGVARTALWATPGCAATWWVLRRSRRPAPSPPPAAKAFKDIDLRDTRWAPPSVPPVAFVERRIETKPPKAPATVVGSGSPAMLRADAVSAWFGARKVLERCSLTMAPRRVTALIGPSGCGKSTFLRTLNRMHEVVPGARLAGRVELDGVDVYGHELSATAVRMRIGMVFQKPNPFPSMTIAQNVVSGLKLAGRSIGDREAIVEESLTRAGLWKEVKDRLHEGGASLSGGQQQRLCIARALAVRPQVLLMDEPCSALDPISTRVIEETIRQLAHEVTIVIVTHNMQQAQRVSDESAFFLVGEVRDPGRIVESGPTSKMFAAPDDSRTLDYVSGRFG